jgi:uncharacterized membrane protein
MRRCRSRAYTDAMASVRVTLGFLLGVGVLAGCEHDHGSGGAATNAVCPPTPTLTYENFGKGFMQTYCLRCHSQTVTSSARKGAPSDHNFDTFADIKPLADHIDGYAGSGPGATNTRMPPDTPKPSVEERAKLSEWLACSAI